LAVPAVHPSITERRECAAALSKRVRAEFLEQAARELLEKEWKERTTDKLPEPAGPLAAGARLG